jgi:pyrroloquinoline quinone (PQQ) biosynthesis protein C
MNLSFESFCERITRDIDTHCVITNNLYTKWFKQGKADSNDMRKLIQQFARFSKRFSVAQSMFMDNARSVEAEEAARDILVNENGVGITVKTGSAEGHNFSHKQAHIEWLRDMGADLGLDRNKLGHRSMASGTTCLFLEELEELADNDNENVSAGATFGIEYWAGFGLSGSDVDNNFWKELITGSEIFNDKHRVARGLSPLNLSFFESHFALEQAHVNNVNITLKEDFSNPDFDEHDWFDGAMRMLDAINIFWHGLYVNSSGFDDSLTR